MSDCTNCPVEKECHYPYKPCDCIHQRKFWNKDRREEYNIQELKIKNNDKTSGNSKNDGR